MFQLKLFNNHSEDNLMSAKACFAAYKRALNEALKNYDPSQTNPYINIKIVSDFPNKEELIKWNKALTQVYQHINTNLKQGYMSDYNTGIKKSASGWTHTFAHLLNVKGIEAMQQLFVDDFLGQDQQLSNSVSL